MIPVTRPFLAPIERVQKLISETWDRQWLTNNGPLVNSLELRLKEYLDQDHMLYVSNGTVALQLAIKALDLKGKILTTPFTYVATTSSIVWEGSEPIFVDINAQTLNIDSDKIEESITEDTVAILATHCFGVPCDIDKIDEIAKRHNLKVIYDAAHCFGTKYKGKSVFKYGDISTCSFHATKVFHTVEGGAVFTKDPELLKKMAYMRNFGHDGPEKFNGLGINGKNSELHAAVGLVNLDYIDDVLKSRKDQHDTYNKLFKLLNIKNQKFTEDSEVNYSYYPVIFSKEEELLRAFEVLNLQEIFPRRYFYPSLNNLDYVNNSDVPVAEDISRRIACLPVYYGLTESEQEVISRLLLRTQNYK